MAVTTYTPTGISHTTSVDFSKRSISQPVHIVQYDRTLPILAVSLYNNGQLYFLPESMGVSIRFGKPDKTFVYNKALGCNEDRTIVYFEITQQMSLFYGEFYPVIELTDGESIANSSTIYIIVDKNPVQHDYIESTIEYKEIIEYRNEALEAAENAKESEVNAKTSETNAKTSETNVKEFETNAKTSETNAKESEDNAKTSEVNAKTSETNAKESETNAKLSETNASTSETNAKISEVNAATSETNTKTYETNTKTYETNASNYANISKSYAVGTSNEVRENDSEDNAKRYSEVAKEQAETCKTCAENAQNSMNEIIKQLKATEFEVDFTTGELVQKTDNEFIFSINKTTGNLEWEVAI